MVTKPGSFGLASPWPRLLLPSSLVVILYPPRFCLSHSCLRTLTEFVYFECSCSLPLPPLSLYAWQSFPSSGLWFKYLFFSQASSESPEDGRDVKSCSYMLSLDLQWGTQLIRLLPGVWSGMHILPGLWVVRTSPNTLLSMVGSETNVFFRVHTTICPQSASLLPNICSSTRSLGAIRWVPWWERMALNHG